MTLKEYLVYSKTASMFELLSVVIKVANDLDVAEIDEAYSNCNAMSTNELEAMQLLWFAKHHLWVSK